MKSGNRPNEAFAATVALIVRKKRTAIEVAKMIDVSEEHVRRYMRLLEEEGLVGREDYGASDYDISRSPIGRPPIVWIWLGAAGVASEG